jgi:hypothetical protein
VGDGVCVRVDVATPALPLCVAERVCVAVLVCVRVLEWVAVAERERVAVCDAVCVRDLETVCGRRWRAWERVLSESTG